ncbi:hypothetical protein C7441_11686 [Pseudaminobacter salicylatoxidans]|uniref:Uncharacterized protein n=1 Tax=Pseudaminobacter salicylatoxidans TaxID=93369 RepID=A0A316BVY0_PSESE|nr:hypothetical protein [Pseudaminobacter salicylatoxidans]PWJ78419.1 hypothetical protein C7441_11686 [Pseudaminobacter salicylatoxidans]
MTRLRIEKFINGERETTVNVPLFAVRALNAVLPSSALGSLGMHGIDLSKILEAKRSGAAYSTTLDLHEHGVAKTVVVSLA